MARSAGTGKALSAVGAGDLIGRLSRAALAMLGLLVVGGASGAALAQTCTVVSSNGRDTVTLSSGSCTIPPGSTLTGAPGVHATTSAQITADNVTLSPFDGGSTAALAETLGTIIFGAGSVITGNYSTAAAALTGGQIIFQDGSTINPAFGGGGTTLLANGDGSLISATGLTLGVNGSGGNVAAAATGGGTIMLGGGTTITYAQGGGGNTALLASGAGSQITTDGLTLSMPGGGGGDIGAESTGGAAVTLNNSSLTLAGNGGNERGLVADGAGSSIVGDGTTVAVSSQNGPAIGGVLDGGASIALTGGSVTTASVSPPGSFGFLFQGPAGADTLSLNGTTVDSAADAFAVQSGDATINTTGATVTGEPYSGNDGILMSVVNGASATLTSDSSTLTGAITTASDSTSDVTLNNGTLWNMTASSNATNVANNASTINELPPTGDPTVLASYKTLTVNNYSGSGGQIVMNTFVGTDSSPSDQLIVNGGTATGSTALIVHNTTGLGAFTNNNGILVVDAVNGGTTAPGAFTLGNPVRPGAFDYRLFRGPEFSGDTGVTNNWYLRNSLVSNEVEDEPEEPATTPELRPPTHPSVPPPPGTPPTTDVVPGSPFLPPAPPPGNSIPSSPPQNPGDPSDPDDLPIIGPELATYGVVQPIARELGLMTLGTLQDRVGDAAAANACLASTATGTDTGAALVTKAPIVADCRQQVWGRFFGQDVNNHYQAFADPSASGWMGGFQGGIDLYHGSLWGRGRDVAGIYFSYGTAAIDVSGLVTNDAATAYIRTGTGKVALTGLSAAGYWTHYGPTGWYFDAVLQGTAYEGHAASQRASLPTDGTGFVSSLEGGYPIPVPLSFFGPSFVLEPEAQIIFQQVRFANANDGLGSVGLGTTSGATGRLGLRGQWSILGEDGQLWQPYVSANVWRDWNAQATTVFGVDQVPLSEQATRLEFAGGLTARINPRLSVYGQAGYQFAVSQTTDGVARNAVMTDIGVRYQW